CDLVRLELQLLRRLRRKLVAPVRRASSHPHSCPSSDAPNCAHTSPIGRHYCQLRARLRKLAGVGAKDSRAAQNAWTDKPATSRGARRRPQLGAALGGGGSLRYTQALPAHGRHAGVTGSKGARVVVLRRLFGSVVFDEVFGSVVQRACVSSLVR